MIDFPALLAKLAKLPAALEPGKAYDYSAASRVQADVPNDLSFLVGVRQRIKLPEPTAARARSSLVGSKAYVANYFSDTLSVDRPGRRSTPSAEIDPAGAEAGMTRRRAQGEFYFHDASICFQGWQSCASCHPGDARVDGLNWDLLNDGIGNPKNNKSLLLAHKTPPAMSMGVRDTAEAAVRAGIRHILFTVQPEEVPTAMDAYLKSLKPVPSPHLVNGKLSAAAQRGKKLFQNARVGCAACHPPACSPTSSRTTSARAASSTSRPTEFDTPTLVEVWRTAPYLHDGSAATMPRRAHHHEPERPARQDHPPYPAANR